MVFIKIMGRILMLVGAILVFSDLFSNELNIPEIIIRNKWTIFVIGAIIYWSTKYKEYLNDKKSIQKRQ